MSSREKLGTHGIFFCEISKKVLDFCLIIWDNTSIDDEGLAHIIINQTGIAHIPWKGNIMKRIVSNIQNLGFTIVNAPSEDKKVKQGGIILDQTLVNGQSQGVSVRLINGTKKTAAVKLDKGALQDLLEAVNEVLATEG